MSNYAHGNACLRSEETAQEAGRDLRTRLAGQHRAGLSGYVAELGNVILCTHLGLTPDFEQSAAYVESWLRR